MLGPCVSVDNPVFVSCRCGLSHKSKLSYEKFLSAFEDNRHAGYGRVTLDTPGKVVTPVVFERHDSLTPEAAINRLRSKISENPETIQRVSVLMSRIASCGKKFLPYIDRNFSKKFLKDIIFRKSLTARPLLWGTLVCQLRNEVALKEELDTQHPLGCAGEWGFAVPFYAVQDCS